MRPEFLERITVNRGIYPGETEMRAWKNIDTENTCFFLTVSGIYGSIGPGSFKPEIFIFRNQEDRFQDAVLLKKTADLTKRCRLLSAIDSNDLEFMGQAGNSHRIAANLGKELDG